MSRWIFVGLMLLTGLAAGCGGERDKNINRDRGRQRTEEKTEAPKPAR